MSTLGAWIAVLCIVGASEAFSLDAHKPEIEMPQTRRAEGLVFMDLPFQIRARFDLSYTDDLYRSDALARPYATMAGPRVRDDESFASQLALTRSLSKNVEIGIVWGARSPVAPIGIFDFGKQTVGAMIRIVR